MRDKLEFKLNSQDPFAEKIFEMLQQREMSIYELGKKAGINPSSLCSWLNESQRGHTKSITSIRLAKLMTALEVRL